MQQLSENNPSCGQQDSKQGESVASGPQSRPVAAGRGFNRRSAGELLGVEGAPVTDLGLVAVDPSWASLLVQLIRRCAAKC